MRKRILSLSLMTMLMAAGCGQETGETTGEARSAGTEQEEPLTVYLNDFDEMIEPLFEEKTGYDIELVTGNGAEIQSRMEAEKGNPNWDVVWMDGQSAFARWDSEDLLLDWEPENVGNLNELGQSLLPESNTYIPTGAHASSVLVYNTNEISEENAPTTWKDLSNPEYKDAVGMADPAIAAPAYPFVSWFFEDLGMDGGKEFFGDVFANGANVYPKNPNVVEGLLSGDLHVAALQESNAYSMKNDGEPIEVVWPEEGAPASVRYAAINKETENEEVAKAFVEFLLEKETQEEMIAEGPEGYFTSTISDVEDLPERPEDPKLLIADPHYSAEHEAEIKEWFADQSVK